MAQMRQQVSPKGLARVATRKALDDAAWNDLAIDGAIRDVLAEGDAWRSRSEIVTSLAGNGPRTLRDAKGKEWEERVRKIHQAIDRLRGQGGIAIKLRRYEQRIAL